MLVNLPNAVVMISKLLIIEAKLIHKVSSHLLDLVVRKSLKHASQFELDYISDNKSPQYFILCVLISMYLL